MTPKDLLENYYKEMKEKLSAYYKAENELSEQGNGFIDKVYFAEISKKYKEWQKAHDQLYTYLKILQERGEVEGALPFKISN